MADFLDKMLVGINKGVTSVRNGSKTMLEKAQLNMAVSEAEQEKQALLGRLGLLTYQSYLEGGTLPRALHDLCLTIMDKEGALQALQKKLSDLDRTEQCADGITCACGFRTGSNARFCPKCGAALERT